MKMLKRKSHDELEILEKLKFCLILISVVLPVLTKQITTTKQRKHKAIEENLIEESLGALNARIWL